jgi:two-component sensor histidine kinase
MAMIHETLYQSADLAQFSLADYLHELTDYLLGAYGRTTSNLVLDVQVAPVSLALDQAIPCGLIVTELVSNSLKHAFSSADDEPAGPRGRLKVSLHSQDGQVELVVRDDGAGLPTDLQVHAVDSLGLRLVDLLTQQLRGTLDVESKADQGSAFCIRFPTQEEKERQPEARNAPGLRRRGDG